MKFYIDIFHFCLNSTIKHLYIVFNHIALSITALAHPISHTKYKNSTISFRFTKIYSLIQYTKIVQYYTDI